MKGLILSCVVMFSALIVLDAQAEEPPAKPRLRSPGKSKEPGEEIKNLTPLFKWRRVKNATHYELYVDQHPYGAGYEVYRSQKKITDTEHRLRPRLLSASKKYRWRVRAFQNLTAGEFSDYLYFHVSDTIDTPRLRSPGRSKEPGREINELAPRLKWRTVEGADMYMVSVHETPYDTKNLVHKTLVAGNVKEIGIPHGKLKPGGKYRWVVRAYRRTVPSELSEPLYFRVAETVEEIKPERRPEFDSTIPTPRLRSPGSTLDKPEIITDLQPTFRWRRVRDAERYGLYIRDNPYGRDNFVYKNENIEATEFQIPEGVLKYLPPGRSYFWGVRAFQGNKASRLTYLYFRVEEEKIQLQWPMSGTITRATTDGHRGIDIATGDPKKKKLRDKLPRVRKARKEDGSYEYLSDGEMDQWRAKKEDGTHVFYSGASVYAAAEGTVKVIDSKWDFGRYIVIDHGGDYKTIYAHLYDISVKEGDKVRAGKKIGIEGNTGNVLFTEGQLTATGLHLHFAFFFEKVLRDDIPSRDELISLTTYKAGQEVTRRTPIKGWEVPAPR